MENDPKKSINLHVAHISEHRSI